MGSPALTSLLKGLVVRDPTAGEWLRFDDPVDILSTREPSGILGVLEETEQRVRQERLFAAGYLTYEAARGFDDAFRTRQAAGLPLICLGLFREPRRTVVPPTVQHLPTPQSQPAPSWRMAESRHDYYRKIAAIQDRIRAGFTYQINYTTRQVAEGIQDPWALFLRIAVDAPYAAYVDGGDHAIVCASPELFFRLDRNRVRCEPMKGTVKRGMTLAQDRDLAAWLARSAKNRAENVMIADMVRNDLGRIAKPGSVAVSELCALSRFPTLWQMTSTVEARTDAPVSEVMRSLFPSASVTGAPKVSSMRLIQSLERFPREIYTGAIGYLTPEGLAQFNVAIRTAVVDTRSGSAFYGVGSGIVADSQPGEEYAECLTKSRILASPAQGTDFSLLETMLWTPAQGVFLFDYHLKRMAESAQYFGFSFDRRAVEAALDELTRTFGQNRYRIRLIQSRDSALQLEHNVLRHSVSPPGPLIGLAQQPVDREDPFLYHKTTRRDVYRRALESVSGCDDVLLWNADGFITETSIANVVVDIGGQRVTPPVTCGLLGGTYRQWLLDRGEIRERKIHIDDLSRIDELTLVNSVRGETPARLRTLENPAVAAVCSRSV